MTYLKDTNLKELIIDNKYNKTYPTQIVSLQDSENNFDFAITNNKINICHGFEHSLCSLLTLICHLLPLLKLYHIKHLFIDHKEMKKIVYIIDAFLKQYCNLPHIRSRRAFERTRAYRIFGSKSCNEPYT